MKRVGFENEFELAGTLLILGIEKIKYVFTIDMLVLSIWSFKCPGGLAHCIDDFGECGARNVVESTFVHGCADRAAESVYFGVADAVKHFENEIPPNEINEGIVYNHVCE